MESLENKDNERFSHNVREILSKHNIDFSSWGTGSSKTIEHLIREVQNNETLLVEEGGEVIRVVKVLYINIECFVDNERRELFEDRQEFTDGRVRRRSSYLGGSLAEKLKLDESPNKEAVIRALEEEIGISRVKKAEEVKRTVSEEDSPSYPGLRGRFENYYWNVELFPENFNEEGYLERQGDKVTYFNWK